jgi:predicted DNA-binding ribbon-helix-helix protein
MRPMKSVVIKRSIIIERHKTSVSLEDAFWVGLKEIAKGQHTTLSSMVGEIDTQRREGNLSSALRLFVLENLREQAPKLPEKSAEISMNGSGSQSHV